MGRCYEWEYAECANGTLSCTPCEGLVTLRQGGWTLRTYTRCPVGQYRSPCNPSCVFPTAGNVRGQCVECTNAKTLHAVYTSSGDPHDENNCEWTCADGYNKTEVDGREQCVSNSAAALRRLEVEEVDDGSLFRESSGRFMPVYTRK
mmetsp:Transcript_50794/g.101477  ORF Transcript_50794/g.101477 Transcript_50794/m.101477 type:complete len:147 (-) Transcript_50794:8-448(-)